VVFQRPLWAGSDVGRGTAPLIGSGVPFQGLQRSAKGSPKVAKACVVVRCDGFWWISTLRSDCPSKIDNLEARKIIEVSEMRQCGDIHPFKTQETTQHSATKKSTVMSG
jgi:hypothetical protein